MTTYVLQRAQNLKPMVENYINMLMRKVHPRVLLMQYYSSYQRDVIYAYLFGVSLLVLLLFFLATALLYSGPMVLGTEINGNGSIEYLCLGRDCEDLAVITW